VADRLPLPALLSHALVAFTIEFDNEFERRVPHGTTRSKATSLRGTPWLVSMVMWSNFMRFVREGGTSMRELKTLTGLTKDALSRWVDRMEKWWGYVVVDRREDVVRPSAGGLNAQEVWRPLFGVIETRWEGRFGRDVIASLRENLQMLADSLDLPLPEYVPVMGYGLFSRALFWKASAPASGQPLTALLSNVLLAFALEYERDWGLSLAISANILQLLSAEGVPVRDLPKLSGVSKEGIKMALGFLEKGNYLVVETRLARLTAKGIAAQARYRERLREIETGWESQFGQDTIAKVRESLESLPVELLLLGVEPYPDGWRASVPRRVTLPHFPMVLHRGGFPDGA